MTLELDIRARKGFISLAHTKARFNPNEFDPNFITDTFFEGLSPTDINFGNCYHWAYVAHQLYSRFNIELYSTVDTGGHAFIYLNGKFYDSESTAGVFDWHNLMTFVRGYESNAIKQSLSEYKKHWRFMWNDWETFDNKIRKILHG